MAQSVSIPRGTRDFAPEVMVRRNYIFQVIRTHFERFGYLPLETPAMENLETLTGKYGDEGDQLIFKILNNGDFLKEVNEAAYASRDSKRLAADICDRALRYDLTVPFARFVVMNQHAVAFPFKRYQIQPVWRADRPQKGRYREFYQCDADVIGTDSLVNEVELVQLFDAVLSDLLGKSNESPAFEIRINNRKVLSGLAEVAGIADRMMEMTIAIDKLDKIGAEGVEKELRERGFDDRSLRAIQQFLTLSGNNDEKLNALSTLLAESAIGQKGIEELRYIFNTVAVLGLNRGEAVLDVTLARGLNYYTGAIFEVKAHGVQMGSICGGGRYDDLTGIFGLPGMSGVGISFGADRIYDVMLELGLFPAATGSITQILFSNFGEQEELHCMQLMSRMRQAGCRTEMYPERGVRMKKLFKYAEDKGIPFLAIVGSDEMASGKIALKNVKTGEQLSLTTEEAIAHIQKEQNS